MYCTINIRYKTRFTAVSYNNRIFTVLSHSYSSIMASHPTEESVDTELLESARKAMKSNGQVRLINIILQVLHKRYFDRKTAVTFSGIYLIFLNLIFLAIVVDLSYKNISN